MTDNLGTIGRRISGSRIKEFVAASPYGPAVLTLDDDSRITFMAYWRNDDHADLEIIWHEGHGDRELEVVLGAAQDI